MPCPPHDPHLQARANTARQLIRAGKLDPHLGLAWTVWPPPHVLEWQRETTTLRKAS